jgi:hypothetical protein
MCLQKPFLDNFVVVHIDQIFSDTDIENYELSQKRPSAIKYCNAEEDVYLCSNYLFLHVLCLFSLWLTADILQTPDGCVPFFLVFVAKFGLD